MMVSKRNNDFTAEILEPGTKPYVFEITSVKDETVPGIYSNMIQNDVTICGKEELKLTDAAVFKQTFAGQGEALEIPYATYEGWFAIGNAGTSGVSPGCQITSYRLVVVEEDAFVMAVGACKTKADGAKSLPDDISKYEQITTGDQIKKTENCR